MLTAGRRLLFLGASLYLLVAADISDVSYSAGQPYALRRPLYGWWKGYVLWHNSMSVSKLYVRCGCCRLRVCPIQVQVRHISQCTLFDVFIGDTWYTDKAFVVACDGCAL
jgi:hypothetical protein